MTAHHLIIAVAVIIAVFTVVAAATWHTAGAAVRTRDPRERSRGVHRRDALERAERRSMARLRGQRDPGVVPGDRFSDPTVVLPRTPRLDEPDPEPLHLSFPPVTGEEAEAFRRRFLDALAASTRPAVLRPLPPEVAKASPVANPVTSGGVGRHETLAERYERLFPEHPPAVMASPFVELDRRPGWLREMEPYPDTSWAVESMFTRAQADQVRALVTGGGQVHGG